MEKICVLKINPQMVFAVFCLLAYLRPEFLVRIPIFSFGYDLYRILVACIISIKYFAKKNKSLSFVMLWGVFEAWILFSTLYNDGNISYVISQAITIITIAFLFDLYSKSIILLYKSLYIVLSIFICINFITLLIYPDGMYNTGVIGETTANWFLGFKNKHIVYHLPLIGVIMILGKVEGYNFKKISIMIITILSALFVNSSTTILCIAVILIVGLLPFIRTHYKLFNMYSFFGVSIVMFFAIPIFRLQHLFNYIIVNILNKDISLTYRTDIWDDALSAIAQHPFMGWGEQSSVIRHQLYKSTSVISAHNQLLEYLYIGGFVLLILYILINLMLARHVYIQRKHEVVQIASALFLALQIALIAEVYTDASIYMIYFIIWHVTSLAQTN